MKNKKTRRTMIASFVSALLCEILGRYLGCAELNKMEYAALYMLTFLCLNELFKDIEQRVIGL